MNINEQVMLESEKISFRLRELFASKGYAPFRMSKFEEYDLYAENKEFLVSDNVITFTDTDGRLMALKPDVTLSVIKNSRDEPEKLRKIYYNENVYRVTGGTDGFREIMQSGVECIGNVKTGDVAAVILLAAESLALLSDKWELDICDMGLSEALINSCIPEEKRKNIYKALGERNLHEIRRICEESNALQVYEGLSSLLSVDGTLNTCTYGFSGTFAEVIELLKKSPLSEHIKPDFSLTADTRYYNGTVFKGFIDGTPDTVISGGMYDRLMQKLHRKSSAIGFAVYTDALNRADTPDEVMGDGSDWLNVALPKGRLGEKVYSMFAEAGFECPSILENTRKLIFENAEKKVRYFWVKPSDVAIYVERGAADIGVAGKDILLEYRPDVFELLDTGLGKCRMCVAAPDTYNPEKPGTVRVATKFSGIAASYYRSIGRDIDIIHLNGSIEIAPILGLSDVIVDIVETGTTLRENHLRVFEEILPISARLIANKVSYRFKKPAIETIRRALEEKNI